MIVKQNVVLMENVKWLIRVLIQDHVLEMIAAVLLEDHPPQRRLPEACVTATAAGIAPTARNYDRGS